MNCTKPHQSGMERKHEEWITQVLNFLHEHNVQTYSGGWNANSTEGMSLPRGPILEIPDRLKIFNTKIREAGVAHRNLRDGLYLESKKHQETQKHLDAAEDELELLWGMIGDGLDMDALQQDETLEALLRKRRPHLFKEE